MLKQSSRLVTRHWGHFLREFSALYALPLSRKHLISEESQVSPERLLNKARSLDLCCRSYAKNRDKKREKNRKGRFDLSELKIYFDVEKMLSDFEKPLDQFKQELNVHATLRSAAGAIENQKIEFEGEQYTIQDLAEVGKKNPRLYVLDFSAFPGAIQPAVSVLQKSQLNLNVQQEGNNVIVPIPKVTKEHRQLLVKRSKLYFVKCKDDIRQVQMKYAKCLGKAESLGSEDKFRLINHLTALGDSQIEIAEEILKAKQHDLLNDDEHQ